MIRAARKLGQNFVQAKNKLQNKMEVGLDTYVIRFYVIGWIWIALSICFLVVNIVLLLNLQHPLTYLLTIAAVS